jgi:hypothetical protein
MSGPDTSADIPAPVLFNTWKHHAGALRARIREAASIPGGLEVLARSLVVVGSDLMDLYVGNLTPAAIAAELLDGLREEGRLELDFFRIWIAKSGGFTVRFLSDGSCWVLRSGEGEGRYVHVHPGRWSPHTRRVRANVLRTAVIASADALVRGGDPRDPLRLDRVRRDFLGLGPVGPGGAAIAEVIEVLADTTPGVPGA